MDGKWMVEVASETRLKPGETEKLTINLGVVDLGQVDLLVQEGFYSNRTDLIRTAIRNQLAVHREEVKRTVGRMLHIHVVGLARIADDVSPELARATIQSVEVLGAFHASAKVRNALADRIH